MRSKLHWSNVRTEVLHILSPNSSSHKSNMSVKSVELCKVVQKICQWCVDGVIDATECKAHRLGDLYGTRSVATAFFSFPCQRKKRMSVFPLTPFAKGCDRRVRKMTRGKRQTRVNRGYHWQSKEIGGKKFTDTNRSHCRSKFAKKKKACDRQRKSCRKCRKGQKKKSQKRTKSGTKKGLKELGMWKSITCHKRKRENVPCRPPSAYGFGQNK
jgi:hypothetical protein